MQRTFANETERRAFRDELEQMLRRGEAEAVLEQARSRLRSVAGANPTLAERALTTRVEDIALTGWDELAARIRSVEANGNEPVTALEIDFSWPGHFATTIKDGEVMLDYDADGGFTPALETTYLGDMREVKFSSASREDILSGYTGYGSEWQGCFIEIDNLIGVTGMDALYGAVQAFKPRDDDTAEGDLHQLAACISAILLHLAVKRTIVTEGLPKPMAVLVGSNEDFPFFDAPVASVDESAEFVAVFQAREARRRDEAEAASARRAAERDAREAEPPTFDPLAAMEHFAEAAKVGREIIGQMRKEKDIFLGIGALGLAIVVNHFRNRE